jgi:alkaline phosphatase D
MSRTPITVSRRSALTAGVPSATAVPTASLLASRAYAGVTLPANPFTPGFASGDPAAAGVVLWTRLALEPLAEDRLGGMPDRNVEVSWQVAADERFSRLEATGTAVARPESAHSVHVELHNLRDGLRFLCPVRARLLHRLPAGSRRSTPTSSCT